MKTAIKYFLIYLGLSFLGGLALVIPALIIESPLTIKINASEPLGHMLAGIGI